MWIYRCPSTFIFRFWNSCSASFFWATPTLRSNPDFELNLWSILWFSLSEAWYAKEIGLKLEFAKPLCPLSLKRFPQIILLWVLRVFSFLLNIFVSKLEGLILLSLHSTWSLGFIISFISCSKSSLSLSYFKLKLGLWMLLSQICSKIA